LGISEIFLYDEPSVPEIKIKELAKFIEKLANVKVSVRKNIFNHFNLDRKKAFDLASLRIFNVYTPFERHTPTLEEVNFEERSFMDSSIHNNIILYDGFELQKFLTDIIPEEESNSNKFHLALTSRLVCTYDYDDYRYHGRAVICSNPSIISTTGVIEAPAKPREFYLNLHRYINEGLNLEVLKNQFSEKFLDYHDVKIGKAIQGYAMQTIFYYLTSEPFCQNPDCILYNAHWQEELLHSQIEIGSLCERHQKIIDKNQKYA
jgi:hypothetical protein